MAVGDGVANGLRFWSSGLRLVVGVADGCNGDSGVARSRPQAARIKATPLPSAPITRRRLHRWLRRDDSGWVCACSTEIASVSVGDLCCSISWDFAGWFSGNCLFDIKNNYSIGVKLPQIKKSSTMYTL